MDDLIFHKSNKICCVKTLCLSALNCETCQQCQKTSKYCVAEISIVVSMLTSQPLVVVCLKKLMTNNTNVFLVLRVLSPAA